MLIALAQGSRDVPKQPGTQILLTSWSYLFSSTSFSASLSLSLLFHPPNPVIFSVAACLSRLAFLLSLSLSLSGCSATVRNESVSCLHSFSPSLFSGAHSCQRTKCFPFPPQSLVCQRSLHPCIPPSPTCPSLFPKPEDARDFHLFEADFSGRWMKSRPCLPLSF